MKKAGFYSGLAMLDQSRVKSSSGPSPDITSLRGKRIVWCSETNEGRHLNTGKVKWLTGGDTLTGREMYGRDLIKFKPTHTLFLLTNSRPHAPAHDFALWERIFLIPFNNRFVLEPHLENEFRRDEKLLKKLKNQQFIKPDH